ncbi:MAG: KpsF/GutQ family sugar-phosphate isomerase [Planctomycetales bacterium]|nr:KpsF/GutQ family sugar-phosphate isomerase [Planctomycetales bacterium]
MSAEVRRRSLHSEQQTSHDFLTECGKRILDAEIGVLKSVCDSLTDSFSLSVQAILACEGKVVVCGMGKAGIVGQKLAASLSSTGTPSHFLHPAEAVHGDLGLVHSRDIVLLLSYSGETEEVIRLLPALNELASGTLAITARAESTLACGVDVAILIGAHPEACPLNLAPSSSTTAMMAVGDALALVASEQRGFTREQFARFHPGGSLGRRLMNVDEIMRPLAECRIAGQNQTVREVMIHVSRPGRRTGAIMLTDQNGRLAGLFTDSDLAKLLERNGESELDQAISLVMTRDIQTIASGRLLGDAMNIMTSRKISELPVVTTDRRPLGIVDVTDVLVGINGVSSGQKEEQDVAPRILSMRPRQSS